METEYKIERWDVMYDDKENLKRPLLYIIPDEGLLKFAELNPDTLYITMKGTGIECYDGIKLKANLFSSGVYPVERPNFFDNTGYYVIALNDTLWLGYPYKLGTVSFQGENTIELKGEPTKSPTPTPKTKENYESTEHGEVNNIEGFCSCSNVSSKTNVILITLSIVLILLFIVRFIINMK
jgi:hypothetical protein